jgi:hypothetical protein
VGWASVPASPGTGDRCLMECPDRRSNDLRPDHVAHEAGTGAHWPTTPFFRSRKQSEKKRYWTRDTRRVYWSLG